MRKDGQTLFVLSKKVEQGNTQRKNRMYQIKGNRYNCYLLVGVTPVTVGASVTEKGCTQ